MAWMLVHKSQLAIEAIEDTVGARLSYNTLMEAVKDESSHPNDKHTEVVQQWQSDIYHLLHR